MGSVIFIRIILIFTITFIYLMIRNELVCKFLTHCSKAACNNMVNYINSMKDDEEFNKNRDKYAVLLKMRDSIYEKSYDRVLFSLKPLKLKYWFTPEQIEFLRNGGYK